MAFRKSFTRLLSFAGAFALLAGLATSADAGQILIRQPQIIRQAPHPLVAQYRTYLSGGQINPDRLKCRGIAFPNVCVEQGKTAHLGIQLNCTQSGNPISCGNVTWSASSTSPDLSFSFSPNPGPPPNGTTTESITATPTGRGVKTQTISWTCDGFSGCAGSANALVKITK